MLRKWKLIIIVILAVCCTAAELTAQTNFGSEAELKKQADKLFEQEEFVKAYPLFSQLLAIYPKDPNYNYKFGVCMLYYADDKEKAIPYLEFASRSPEVEKEVFYYLGRAYHLNYRFNDAINTYGIYKQKAGEKQAQKYQVDLSIKQCENGKKLLKNLTDLVVMDKKELSRADFYNAYKLDEFNAKVIVKPDDFKTSYDKKKKDNGVMYEEQGKDVVFFSSYGEDGSMGKDIFMKKRLPNGEFGKPINLGYPVNTEADEDYPFIHPNGKILYFCSKGHNSMGGYDIFKSELNEETGTWTKPVNMDFAINTPDDDIFFVSDADDKIGYFASTRTSSGDMITVYKIVIDRKPADIAIIKGKVKREDEANGLSAKITVKNMDNGQIIGIFNSKDKTGDYLLNLPNGGKFLFTVEAPGYKPFSDMVEIPVQYELKPLGQEIVLKMLDGKGVVQIVNKFDQNVSDEDYLYAMDFIKKRANLDVNYGQQDTLSSQLPPDADDSDDVKKDHPKKDVRKDISNDDIISDAYTDAKDAQKDANELRKDADNAQYLANQKNDSLQQKQKELEQQQQVVDNTTDPQQKQQEQEKYDAMKKETDLYTQETIITNNLSKKLDDDAKKKQEDADFSLKYAKDLEHAIKNSNSSQETIDQLNKTKEMLDDRMKKEHSTTDDFYAGIKKQADDKQKDADKSKQKEEDLKQEITQTESEINRVKTEADKEKNPDLKKSLQDQVDEMTNDLQDKQKELVLVQQKTNDLQKQASDLKTQQQYTDELIDKINKNTYTSVVVKNDDPRKDNTPKPDYTKNTSEINQKYEQQIKDADNITDPLLKEQKKAEIYANWSDDAKKEQDVLKKKLATTTDPVQKKQIQDQVLVLNNEVKDKTKESETSRTNADKIKQQNVLVQNQNPDSVKNPTVNVSDPQSVSKLNENVKQSETVASDLNRKHDDELQQLNNISDPIQKEQKKNEIYKKWVSELDQQTTSLQQQLDTTKKINLNDKIAIQNSINKIKDQQKETQKLSDKSDKKMNELLASNNPDSNKTQQIDTVKNVKNTSDPVLVQKLDKNIKQSETTLVSVDKKYEGELKKTDKITDPVQKEQKKNEIYKKWSDELLVQSQKLQQQLDTSKNVNSTDRQQLQDKINAIGDRQKEKQTLADNSQKKVEQLQNPILVNNDTIGNKNTADTNSSKPLTYADLGPKYDYTSPKSSDNVKKVQELVKQSSDLDRQADSLRVIADKTDDPDKKVELLDKISDLKKESDRKKNESYSLISDANLNEYMKNDQQLDELSKKNFDNDALLVNAMKFDDHAKSLFADARKKREEANSMSGQDKQNTLRQASDLEVEALNEQKKSLDVYSQMNPVLVKNDHPVDSNFVVKKDNPDTLNTNPLVKKDSPVDTSHLKDVAVTEEYRKYNDMRNDANKLHEDAVNEFNKSDDLKKQAKDKSDESQKLIEGTVNVTDEQQKQEMLKRSEQLDKESLQLLAQSDSIRKIGQNDETASDSRHTEAELYRQSLDKTRSDQVLALYDKMNPETQKDVVVKKDNPVDVVVPKNVTEKLDIKPTPVYSKTKPIPLNEKLPEGLVFKVQVGAFRNPIPQDLFRGITPLTGETTSTGLTRYTAGIFTQPDNALKARDQIRGMGYKDAFVVAFLNGKRIPYNDAIAMLNGNKPVSPDNIPPDNVVVKKDQPVVKDNNDVPDHKKDNPPVIVQVNDVKSMNVTAMNGLFYTVQVGVYSKKVTSAQLFGITPLNSEPVGNVIRYSTGIFNDVNKANKTKDRVVAMGVKDAFVTAYYNGKRITLDDAAALLAQKGNGILIGNDQLVDLGDKMKQPQQDQPIVDDQPKKKDTPPIVDDRPKKKDNPPVVDDQPKKKNVTQPETTIVDTSAFAPKQPYVLHPNTAVTDTGIVFKVQIGAFKDEVPIDIANKFIRIHEQGIKNFEDADGLTVYTVGSFLSYDDAAKTKEDVAGQGITDAFVIAFKDGKKITVEDAKKELGQR